MRFSKWIIFSIDVIIIALSLVIYFFLTTVFERSNTKKETDPLFQITSQGHYLKGIDLYKNGNYKQAIVAFKQAIEINPSYENSYKKIIDALLKSNKLNNAKTYFEQLIAKYPENSCPHFSLGPVLIKNEDYQKAIDHLQQAVQLAPQFGDSYAT